MKRRFNSTGRKRISRDLFTIDLQENPETGQRSFTARLKGLHSLGLNEHSRVVLEPYVKQSGTRFDCGTIAELPEEVVGSLADVDRGAAVHFRLLIVDTQEMPGRILASAEQVRPTDSESGQNRRSILPLRETDLGEAVWRVEVDVDTPPTLLLNNRIPGLRQRLAQDPLLQGAIFTHAADRIMRVVLSANVDDEADWVEDWRTFAEALLGEEIPESLPEDASEQLIVRIIDAFDDRHEWRSQIVSASAYEEGTYE